MAIIIISSVATHSVNSHAEECETDDGQYIMESEYEEFDVTEDSKTITFNVNYFTDSYMVSATCSTGPSKYKTYYKDSDYATSALQKTVYSNKFV
ncbi:MAG: hypothetical protein K6C35_09095 [Eubacterium sp.]|nr:hypothetical protein [Eubacterium sp.]